MHQDKPGQWHSSPVTVILGRLTVILGRLTVILGLDPRISRCEQFPQFRRFFAHTMMPGSSPGMPDGTNPSPPKCYPDAILMLS